MDDLVVFADSSELVDIPPCEGAACERTAFSVHRSDLLDSVAHDVVALAAVCKDLVIEVPPQDIDVAVVETN